MRSSDKKLHTALRIVCFLLVVVVFLAACNFFIARENTYTRVMMHEMYSSPEPIDLVFAGASTAYRHFVPEIWDEVLGMHTFNIGSSNQRPDSTYYLLKELFSVQHPKYCILNLNASTLIDQEGFHNPTAYYILADYFRPGLNKLQYMFHAFDGESVYAGLLPFLRYKGSLSLGLIRENYLKKTSADYKNYSYDIYGTDIETYEGRGYVSSARQTEKGHVGELAYYPFSLEWLDQDIIGYTHKIAELCRDNGCELIMIVTPLPYAHIAMQKEFSSETDLCRQVAQDCDAPLFDYTLCRPEYLSLDDTSFYDFGHLSSAGAEAFSAAAAQLVADYIAGRDIDYDALFYGSCQELLDASPYVFNAWIARDGDTYTANCTHGTGVIPEYQFSWRDSPEGEWHILREYGPSEVLDGRLIPAEAAELRLCVRPAGCADEYQQWDSLALS